MQACFTIFLCFKMLSIGAFFGFLNFDWSLSASLSVEFRTHIACSRTVHCNIIDGSLFFFCISLLLFPSHPSKRKKNQLCLTPCSWIFYFSLGFHVITGSTLWYLWGIRVWQWTRCLSQVQWRRRAHVCTWNYFIFLSFFFPITCTSM